MSEQVIPLANPSLGDDGFPADASASRRNFVARALGAAVVAGGVMAAGSATGQTATPTPTPTATTGASVDYLNVALNVLYLKANFYAFATTGSAITSDLQTGLTSLGSQGAATGGRQVSFTDTLIGNFAREIAADALANLKFLRAYLSTGAMAQPAIDLSPAGAFTTAMRAAGVVGASATFDPYASDTNFLLAAFFLADWPIGIYKSIGPVSGSVTILEALGGLVGTESYHSAMIRATLFRLGQTAGSPLIAQTEAISSYRDGLDGAPTEVLTTGYAPDDDQGVAATTNTAGETVSNIVPSNANGITFSRTYDRIINIMYLTNATATTGGFFPAGLNGTFKTSGAAA